MDSRTREPTFCPARPSFQPGITPLRLNVADAPLSHEESKVSPSDHVTPLYCTVTVSSSPTSAPSPWMRGWTTISAGGLPSGLAIVGVPSSPTLTSGRRSSRSVTSAQKSKVSAAPSKAKPTRSFVYETTLFPESACSPNTGFHSIFASRTPNFPP